MARTKRKRRRKHRGTQSGSINRRQSRPRSRAEAKARAKQRSSGPRPLKPPTWQGAAGKGLLAAGLFFGVFVVGFGRAVGASLAVAAFMLLFYIPLSYYLDGFFYRRRIRQEQKAREAG